VTRKSREQVTSKPENVKSGKQAVMHRRKTSKQKSGHTGKVENSSETGEGACCAEGGICDEGICVEHGGDLAAR
jgi:hypothetical protein